MSQLENNTTDLQAVLDCVDELNVSASEAADKLEINTTDLQSILDAVNALPEAGGGGIIEVSTDDEMNGALNDENIGNAYIFTGESGLYTNGDIYIVADGAPSFADASWEQVIIACKTNTVPETWAVGDQKTMTIGDADYTIDIIGKNHDEYSDGSGTAPITFQFHDCYGTKYAYSSGTSTNANGYFKSNVHWRLSNDILAAMPAVVQSSIKEVDKSASKGGQVAAIETVACSLFLLSEIEIFGSHTNSASGEGTQYTYYANGGSTIKNVGDSASVWWERSPDFDTSTMFCAVNTTGSPTVYGASGSYGVAPAFCF